MLVVDDQALVRAGFSSILQREEDLEVVGEAADGVEALEAVGRTASRRRPHGRPDATHGRHRGAPVSCTPAIRPFASSSSPTYDLDEYLIEALRAGACGFLLKDVRAEHLPGAVRAAACGDVLISGAPTRRLAETFIRSSREPSLRVSELPARELDVLRLVAAGLSNAQIAADLYLGEATVKTYISRLLARFGVRDRVGLVIVAYEEGVVLPNSAG